MTLSPHELTGNLHDEPTQRAWRDWLAEHIGLDDEQKQGVYGSIARSATLRDATYWAEIVFAARSAMSADAQSLGHQQLTVLGQRIAEHPDLFVTIEARDDLTRSAMRMATVSAVLRGLGIADERIRTLTTKDERESDRDVVTVNVTRNKAAGVQP